MHRGWMDNPVFGQEPFTEMIAWVWLIENAAWEPRRTRAGALVADLDRGQLAASVRYLAEAWRWSKSRVDRFLHRLVGEKMIELKSGHQTGQAINILSICNYDIYQVKDLTQWDNGGTRAGQAWDKEEKEVNQKKERAPLLDTPPMETPKIVIGSPKTATRSRPGPDPAFDQWWQHYPRKKSKGAARMAFGRALKKADAASLIAGAMRYGAETDRQDPRYVKHPATWLNGECWVDQTDPQPASNGRSGALDALRDIISRRDNSEAIRDA